MSKRISLSRGMETVVDDDDYERLAQYKWYASPNPAGQFYAENHSNPVARKMHRFIMSPPPDMVVDHINGDTLDNRKCNLRIVTRGENSRHRANDKSYCKSKYYGVRVSICSVIIVNGEAIRLGSFPTEEDAARAYNKAHKKYFPDKPAPNKLQ